MRSPWVMAAVFLLSLMVVMPARLTVGPWQLSRPVIDLDWGFVKIKRSLDLRLGLDLQGGTHLVYQAQVDQIPAADRDQAVKAVLINIARRINLLGVAEPMVQTSRVGDQYRLIVELPGVKDVNQAMATIGQTARLEFKEPLSATPSSLLDFTPTGLGGQDLRRAAVQFDGSGRSAGQPVVALEFTPAGAQKFAEITSRSLGRRLAIFLDETILMDPVVQNVITDGRAVISGGFTTEEAKRLAIQLNAGALPVPIKIVEQRNIGPTLGNESIIKSLVAAGVGMVIIWLFMAANYGVRGLVANVALIFYVIISLAIIKLVPVTLTLAGIAGFVLSIGMAVDANILIFERIKEEQRWGRSLKVALELGFHRAWNSIRDSNTSSLITAAILFWFGSGPVRGFALTLAVGVLVSMLSSIQVTKMLLDIIPSKKS